MGGVAKAIGKVIASPLHAVGDIIGGDIGEFFNKVGDFTENVVSGVLDNVANFAVGVVTGDFKKVWSAFTSLATVVLVSIAVVYSGFSILSIVAGLIVLDAQFNGSAFLLYILDIVGNIEHFVFGTDFIHKYKEIIAMSLVLVSTFYIGYQAFEYISNMDSIIALKESYASLFSAFSYIKDVMAGYDIYDGLKTILESKEYWNKLLEQYVSELQAYIDSISAARQQWFDVYSDTETIGRVLAGGDIYNAGAGSDLYSVSDAYEPYRYQTGIISRFMDDELDTASNSERYYYGMAGSDAYLDNLLKG